ncbi:hypothetical protein F4860DRAFT_127728 [Xylaria cubensis]|nr:hypothetical protein F4860DRAFT_127728 [Xylaria cubensis]
MPTLLGKAWAGMTRGLIPWGKQRKQPKERGPSKRSFPIEVTDVKPPTELETRSCARYNTIRKGEMMAVFDPDDKENKISRVALQTLMQARTFREYPCESVCLEWICILNHQPYRTTHRIVDAAEVGTISFYHNRRSDSPGKLSELELILVKLAPTASPRESKTSHNRVLTWPAGKLITRTQSRSNRTPLVATPLGDCDWLESERWELVSRETVTKAELSTSSVQEPFKATRQNESEPYLSSGATHQETQSYPETCSSQELREVSTSKSEDGWRQSREVPRPSLSAVQRITGHDSRSGARSGCTSDSSDNSRQQRRSFCGPEQPQREIRTEDTSEFTEEKSWTSTSKACEGPHDLNTAYGMTKEADNIECRSLVL